jgi:hypothetical protein
MMIKSAKGLVFATPLFLLVLMAMAGGCAGPAPTPPPTPTPTPRPTPVPNPGPTAISYANEISVFQSPNCPCCDEYGAYLRKAGFQVNTRYIQDMSSIKKEYQIPRNMQACHTAITGDYFVEGHVPTKAIKKLLAEKPAIGGIALPGMPPGSPGMPGSKKGAFRIFALSNGMPSVFMIY